jgi:DNA-binding MarR family transcriptional regulator
LSSAPTEPSRQGIRLVEILRALPDGELAALIARLGLRVDPTKRIDTPSQVARALVQLPDLRDPSRLPQPSVELLHRIAEARGSLFVEAAPPALEPLLARGLTFARGTRGRVELLLPAAHLVQLRSWEAEDPRGIRALLAQASFETTSAIAAHYLGRPATPPIALSLEAAWDVLGDPALLGEEMAKLAPQERRILEAVCSEGGEVETEELLELEREPLRLRTATGATTSRRGVGFALERRGLLVPVHPNRHIVPTEVAAILRGAEDLAKEEERAEVRSFVVGGDHAPRRARFSDDNVPLAIALAIAAREPGNETRPGIGTPKSLAAKLAARFGRDAGEVALTIALSRAVGLWDSSAVSAAAPPGSLTLQDLGPLLFVAWRRGGAWDEARTDPEAFRIAPDARDSSPAGVVREMVLGALQDLGEGRWIPWPSLADYLRTDHRVPGLGRLLRRWAERAGAEPVDPIEVARRVALESLPALGLVDTGEDDGDDGARTTSLRLTPRGRALLRDAAPAGPAPATLDAQRSKFLDTHVLRVGGQSRVHAVMALAPFVDIGRVADVLDLLVAPQTLARALSAGFDAEILRQRIEAVAPLPESLSRTLAQASVILGRSQFIASGGFLWVEDTNLRELLRTRRPTAELFVDPSPPAGLLVQVGVDLDRLARRCRSVGIEIVVDGQIVRARSGPTPRVTPSPAPVRLTPSRGTERR